MRSLITVTTSAADGNFRLTTAARVKLDLGLTDNSRDTLIETLIDEASSEIAGFCNRVFPVESVTETFRLECETPREMILRRAPVTEIASVTVDETALETDEYEYDAAAGLLYRLCDDVPIAWCADKIVVAYSGGFVLPGQTSRTLPEAVEKACLTLVKSAFFSRARDPLVKAESLPDIRSVDYWVGSTGGGDVGGLPPDVARMLGPYVLSSGIG
jgi:hypothetical protein